MAKSRSACSLLGLKPRWQGQKTMTGVGPSVSTTAVEPWPIGLRARRTTARAVARCS